MADITVSLSGYTYRAFDNGGVTEPYHRVEAIGTPASAAWGGTGNGDVVALLKGLFGQGSASSAVAFVDYSATFADGASASRLGADPARRKLLIANPSTTATMWVNFGAAAVAGGAGSIPYPPGAMTVDDIQPESGAIHILGTSGQAFTLKAA